MALAGSPDGTTTNYVICKYTASSVLMSAIVQNGKWYSGQSIQGQAPTWMGGSNTITHQTNIIDFDPSQIGTFCASTGELANVYGTDYVPTLERATDAICKVRATNMISSSVVGIITGPNTFASHGDVLCVVDEGSYNVGDIIVPSSTGLCRIATNDEKLLIAINGMPRVKITAIFPEKDFVCCFIQ
jgi:hypothetical protein